MSKRKKAKPDADRPATAAAGMHVPLPAVLMGLGLLGAPAMSQAVAVNDQYTIAADTTLTGVNVTANDGIGGNATVQVIEIGGPTHGIASLATNGALTYTPDPGFRGTDGFGYQLKSNGTSFANVFITVTDPAPVPGLAPATLAALSAGIAGLAMRRRRKS